jgi:hypothetical protein
MTDQFAFEVTGWLGPAIRHAFRGFTFEVRPAHTVLCVRAANPAQLALLVDQLDAAGIDVELVRETRRLNGGHLLPTPRPLQDRAEPTHRD